MAQHSRDNNDRNPAAKRASLLASAQAAQRRSNAVEQESQSDQWQSGQTQPQPDRERPRHQTAQSQGQQQYPRTLRAFVARNSTYILSVVAVIAIVALVLVFLRGCIPQTSPTRSSTIVDNPEEYVSPYDWDKLDYANGRYAYIDGGQVKSRTGIDVSENQYDIDWNAVVADSIDFAIIRLGYRGATEGDLYLDEYYQANLDGAKAAGIDCGVYFFSQAQTPDEAIEEADFVLKALNGTPLEYPIAFDSEEAVLGMEESRVTGLDGDQMTAIAEAFCSRIEAAGYRSMIYGNRADLDRMNYKDLQKHALWWAEYDAIFPSAQIDIVMWQYSHAGQVAGIDTPVDMNLDLSGV